jgi:shikimate kinase
MSNHLTRLVLVGCRGSGKSTVGPLVATRLGWRFLDADVELERAQGVSIADIFRDHGEVHFRELEEANLQSLLKREEVVIATGGGVVVREANRELLTSECVVWLDVPAELAFDRIQSDATTAARRPKLTSASGLDEMRAMIAARSAWYASVATHRIDGTQPAAAIADAVVKLVS